MKGQKALTGALCCCVLALCVAIGTAVHFRQESREAEAQLVAVRERNELLEAELLQLGTQLAQAQEDKENAEKERDSALRQYEWATERNNPIDRYRYGDRASGSATAEMSINNAFFREAWKQELNHLLEAIIEEMELSKEESQCLDEYRRSAEAAGEALVDLIGLMYNNGFIGTLAVPNAEDAVANTYRQYTLGLFNTYYFALAHERYHFAFDDTFVTQWKEKNGEGLTISGEQMFPPISQVFPDQP